MFDDISGIGATGGKVLGIGPPTSMLTREGSRIRQLAVSLYRKKVFLQSGKQINETEAKDEMTQLGMGIASDDQDFLQGVRGLRSEFYNIMQAIEAAFDPSVIDLFQQRGGVTTSGFEKSFGGKDNLKAGIVRDINPARQLELKQRYAPMNLTDEQLTDIAIQVRKNREAGQ